MAALLLAEVAAVSVDQGATFLSNAVFKAREEKKADIFAGLYSSSNELEAAARFFEEYEKYASEYRESLGGDNY